MNDPAATALRDTLARRLRGAANVHGVGLGGRRRAGEPTGEGCLTVLVERKVHRHALSRADLVPAGLGDLRIDVVAVPRPRRLSTVPYEVPGARYVPSKLTWRLVADNRTYPVLCGGIQIMSNVRQPGQGTLGCLLEDLDDPDAGVYALTNYHVLAGGSDRRPAAPDERTRVGNPTAAVGPFGWGGRRFGTYAGGVETSSDDLTARYDAAVVRLDPGTEWHPLVTEIGPIRGVHRVTWPDVVAQPYQVRKRGITTRLTGGVVLAVGFLATEPGSILTSPEVNANDLVIRPNPLPLRPDRTVYFAEDGDSGSVLVNDANEVVGLLWGGILEPGGTAADRIEPELGAGFATPIDDVLDRLGELTGRRLAVAAVTGDALVRTVAAESRSTP